MSKYSDKISLRDRNIIVTGACGLLGKEFCKGIAEFGGNIAVADIDFEDASEFAAELRSVYGVEALPCKLDITSEDSVGRMLEVIKDKLGETDGLVNSAYPRNKTYGTTYENLNFHSWRENIDMHLNGYFNVIHKVSKVMMTQNKGSIVNLGSIYGILGPDFSIYEGTSMTMPAEYSVIKGGIVNFTRYLATRLAKYEIRVNCISPGGIHNNQPQPFVENYSLRTPMGRMGKPEEIVGGVIYLLSDMSSYVTGQNLVIDGGWSAW
ncbi:MAG: oxidoreductase [Clostridia bacterium]|nr:oxidoreductase [Clostridia bacterium]